MRPLRYSINLTLDGCCDHTAVVPSEEMHRYHERALARADAMLLGRTTYEMMQDAWRMPAETGKPADWMEPWMMGFAHTIHGIRKYVVSSTLKNPDWNAELVEGDLESAVQAIKNGPGGVIATGGVTLPRALAELGLIDEWSFMIHPTLAGHGPYLFDGMTDSIELKLTGRDELDGGQVVLHYETRRFA